MLSKGIWTFLKNFTSPVKGITIVGISFIMVLCAWRQLFRCKCMLSFLRRELTAVWVSASMCYWLRRGRVDNSFSETPETQRQKMLSHWSVCSGSFVGPSLGSHRFWLLSWCEFFLLIFGPCGHVFNPVLEGPDDWFLNNIHFIQMYLDNENLHRHNPR